MMSGKRARRSLRLQRRGHLFPFQNRPALPEKRVIPARYHKYSGGLAVVQQPILIGGSVNQVHYNGKGHTHMSEPSTEDQILAVHIGPVPPLNGPICLAEYDPAWPHLFEREAERIRTTLGQRVLLLEHAGSTSVPGLAAKPRIDLLLLLSRLLPIAIARAIAM